MTPQTSPAPTGPELAAAILDAATQSGKPLRDFARPLGQDPHAIVAKLRSVRRPKSDTVDRVLAFLAGKPIATRSSHSPIPPPEACIYLDVDRSPCPKCGIRGDIGCTCRKGW